MTQDQLRDEFEADYIAHAQEKGVFVTLEELHRYRGESGIYSAFPYIQGYWKGWQRARAALVIELPAAQEWPDVEEFGDDHEALEISEAVVGAEIGMRTRCAGAIKDVGVKVK